MAQYHHSRRSNHRRSKNSYEYNRKYGKNKKRPVALIVIGVILLVLIAAGVLFLNYLKGGMKRVKINKDNLGIVEVAPEEIANKKHNITNIAVFGVDTRDSSAAFGDQGRSDSIMIVSVDTTDDSIKIISVLRDTKVPIEGYEPQKINAAYKYGMAPLAIKTLNQNFRLNIQDYVTVDFGMMQQVIDSLGGVDINLTAEEADLVNSYANAVMGYGGYDAVEGANTLNGAQAVSFSRIRSIDSDYERAGRQRMILKSLFAKLRTKPVTQYPALIRSFMDCVETSLAYGDILSLATGVNVARAQLSTYSMPADDSKDLWGGIDETGSWVWTYDLDDAANRIHRIIYGGLE